MTKVKLPLAIFVPFRPISPLLLSARHRPREKKSPHRLRQPLVEQPTALSRRHRQRLFQRTKDSLVEPIFVRGGPIAITALISGNVDFASIGGAQAAIRSKARGLDLHIIASLSNYTNYTLIGSKEAKKARRSARQNYRRHRRRSILRLCDSNLLEAQ